ncbi:MAG: response regulator transcription factor [Verrucomicrobiaceae bacterium]|nr:MAG: response regulator transcription factor [Verrucomicrobiaceae bacterium]
MALSLPRSPVSQPSHEALVCVVDDDDSLRQSLIRLFRSVCLPAEAFASAQAFLDRERHDGPLCLVLDVQMPGLDGLQLQQILTYRKVPIVFLTGNGDVPMCVTAMKAGAVDFLTKPVDDTVLIAAVTNALLRSEQERACAAQREAAVARFDALTPREFEVMQYVIAGMLNKQIAGELEAAEKTVKIHRGRVMQKLGVNSVAELVRLAQVAGVRPVTGRGGA